MDLAVRCLGQFPDDGEAFREVLTRQFLDQALLVQ